ncbi:Oligopeptide transport ATP-binding protein OppD [bioreactor metagenome]|uniref:Oligopeptide transport ATP-binding protein OppD n=1 Tax=bioreactor metagenome TaxID=1076179 RepID=A0A644XMX7_9ZZZZ
MLFMIKDLSVRLKKTGEPIVRNMSFSIDEGKSLIILGQSGSGKTMTCKTITGVLNRRLFAPSGEVFFMGKELLSMRPQRQREIYGAQIALIPQNPMTALDPSVRMGRQMRETLYIHTGLKGDEAGEKLDRALREAGLEQAENVMRCYPYMLSGGMLQRVLIAMALMVNAKLIIADEPTTALDAEHRSATVDALVRLREQGTAILLVTHDFAVAARIGGNLLIMKDGGAIERGEVSEVLTAPEHPYTMALIEASRLSGSIRERSGLAC